MGIQIRILLIEDSEDDALLMLREVRRGGYDVSYRRVDSAQSLSLALDQEEWDLILSDYNLPGFSGLAALKIFKETGRDIPFILISGAVGEEIAVVAMRSGAQDYIKKENMARLVPAIQRELGEVLVRKERAQVRGLLQDSEQRYRNLVDNIPIGVFRSPLDSSSNISMVNQALVHMFGYTNVEEMCSITFKNLLRDTADLIQLQNELMEEDYADLELRLCRKDESLFWGSITARLSKDAEVNESHFDCTIEDITARKTSEKLKDALYKISQASSTTKTLAELLKAFHEIIGALMPANNFYLALYDPANEMISYPYIVDEFDEDPQPEKLGKGLTAYVIRKGLPLLASPEIFDQLVASGEVELVGPPGVDWLGVPLQTQSGQTIGALVVQTYDVGTRYSIQEQEVLTFVSTHVAMAVERKRADEALRESESRQRALLQAIPDVILVVNQQGRIVDFIFSSLTSTRIKPENYLNRRLEALLTKPVARQAMEAVQWVLATHGTRTIELELIPPIGTSTVHIYEARLTLLDVDNVLVLVRDVTMERRAEMRIEQQQAFLRQVLDINPTFIFAKNREGRFTLVNQAVAEAYGTSVENLIGKTDADFSAIPREVEAFLRDDQEVIDTLHEKIIPEESLTDATGQVRWLQTVKRPLIIAERNEVQVLGTSTDITERKRQEAQILYNAYHDSLTGLPNRAKLVEELRICIDKFDAYQNKYFAVLMLDLDEFSIINDSLGYQIGDELILQVPARLLNLVRQSDLIVRVGGDEFAVLVDGIDDRNFVLLLADQIIEDFRHPFLEESHRLTVTISIGIVLGDTSYENPEDILRDADIALNRAKSMGRGRHAIFDNVMRTHVLARLNMESDLRHALVSNQLEIHYEPIISLSSGRPVSFEALIRWRHPQKGLLSPGQFIPFAEETGLIIQLGEWVLEEASRQMKYWEEACPWTTATTVSVNISNRQFSQSDLVDTIKRILINTGLNPNRLRLEITESVLMENADLAITALRQLREIGVQIYIDDFGTGYSSLGYLHRLPLNAIKIDRSFISGGTDETGHGLEIVQTIISLANDLHLATVAEGVETVSQLQQLRALGMNYVQGFLFTKTLSPHQFEEWMLGRNTENDFISQYLPREDD